MKKHWIFFSLFIFLFCIFANLALGREANNIEISSYDRIDMLESKVDVLESLNNKILNTIYWTLGILSSIFVGIVAFNIFQNYSINKKKIDAIQENLDNKFKSNLEKFKTDLQKELDQKTENIDLIVQKKVEKTFSILQKDIGQLKEDYTELKRNNLEMEAEYWKNKKVPANYIDRLIDILKMDIEKSWDFRIHDSLEKIHEHVKAYKLASDTLADLQETLDKLPIRYEKIKKEIGNKMRL